MGARYTDSLTRVNLCNRDFGDGRNDALITGTEDALTGRINPALGRNACLSLNLDNLAGPPYIGELDQDNVSWRGGLNYKPTENALLYVLASRGFKAGSYPEISATSWKQ